MSGHLVDTTAYLRRVLWAILAISIVGVAFSGTLAFRELCGRRVSCPVIGAPGTIFGVPACVFGLLIFAFLALLSGLALIRTSAAGGNPAPRGAR